MKELDQSQTDQVTGALHIKWPPFKKPPVITTLALGEEGGGHVTTLRVGEEGGGPVITTLAIGEEGPGTGSTPIESGGALGSF